MVAVGGGVTGPDAAGRCGFSDHRSSSADLGHFNGRPAVPNLMEYSSPRLGFPLSR